MNKKLFFILFSLSLSFTVIGQSNHQKIATEDLKKDFKILQSSLEKIHPGLYNYHSKQVFDSLFYTYYNSIDRAILPLAYYQKIGPLLKEIGDVHTDIEPPESFYDSLNNHWFVFPISVEWVDNKLYVIRDFSDEQLTTLGDQILTINGVAAPEVFLKVRQYVPRDGYNITSPNHTLSGVLGQFRNYYASIYGHPDSFQLELLTSSGSQKTITIAGLKYKRIFEKYKAARTTKKKQGTNKQLQFEIKDQAGILKVASFHPELIKDGNQKFKKFFKQVFKKMQTANIEKLILDIRGNGGGHESVFIELFKYLTDTPFTAYRQLYAITDKVPNSEFFLEKGQIAYLEKMAKKRLQKQGNLFLRTGGIGLKTIQPKKRNYKGAVAILIDGASSSAAGDFSGLVKAHDRAIFIGEETGGNPYVNTAGLRLTLELPHSRIRVLIPTLKYIINIDNTNTGKGMQPDHPIKLSIQDIIHKRDKALEYALSL